MQAPHFKVTVTLSKAESRPGKKYLEETNLVCTKCHHLCHKKKRKEEENKKQQLCFMAARAFSFLKFKQALSARFNLPSYYKDSRCSLWATLDSQNLFWDCDKYIKSSLGPTIQRFLSRLHFNIKYSDSKQPWGTRQCGCTMKRDSLMRGCYFFFSKPRDRCLHRVWTQQY